MSGTMRITLPVLSDSANTYVSADEVIAFSPNGDDEVTIEFIELDRTRRRLTVSLDELEAAVLALRARSGKP